MLPHKHARSPEQALSDRKIGSHPRHGAPLSLESKNEASARTRTPAHLRYFVTTTAVGIPKTKTQRWAREYPNTPTGRLFSQRITAGAIRKRKSQRPARENSQRPRYKSLEHARECSRFSFTTEPQLRHPQNTTQASLKYDLTAIRQYKPMEWVDAWKQSRNNIVFPRSQVQQTTYHQRRSTRYIFTKN